MVDLSSKISLISLSLLCTSSYLNHAVLASTFRNIDSRFGNTTYQEIDVGREEGFNKGVFSMHLLPAGSEIQIPNVILAPVLVESDAPEKYQNGDERSDTAVVTSIICVLQHADDIYDADSEYSYTSLKRAIRCAVKSLFRADCTDLASLSESLPAHVNVVLGKGSVGAAWWDCLR